MSGVAEDSWGWRRVTRICGRCRGKNVRERRKGMCGKQEGDRDGAILATQHKTGDGMDEAWIQHQRERDGTDRATVPLLALAGADCGGGGGHGQRPERGDGREHEWRRCTCPHGGVSGPARAGRPFRKPWRGLSPMAFLGLTDSTELAGMEPTPQGVARLTNGENRGRRSESRLLR